MWELRAANGEGLVRVWLMWAKSWSDDMSRASGVAWVPKVVMGGKAPGEAKRIGKMEPNKGNDDASSMQRDEPRRLLFAGLEFVDGRVDHKRASRGD